ncbi:hypothetical protein CCR94_10155 [Rhodoblastus sphagnicola]|uniref:Uncharacterized protein n=1 Tax=Rhodoblastus sphagnicola TaxID=333368 RepID=A0A2S6N8Y4_9HYPH|nr:hypothetical protein [Rhodoblastus sphagnicola]MBB4196853.1 hypothetical protein [Rhodoblastus sphagnicola]PPQ31075.1 hypothetical protein CCR94_10155 [Rhodoblastus sphagnicola]
MPVLYEDGVVRFHDHCAVEEAVELAEKLSVEPMPDLDLSECGGMHSALFQLIVAARPKILAWPEHGHLADLLRKALGADHEAEA